MPPPPPSQAPAKLKSCCPHHPDFLNQASSFFYLFPQLFFSFLLNVTNLAATDHQPTPLHSTPKPTRSGRRCPPSTLISLFPDLSLSLNLSLFLPPLTEYIMYMLWINVFILIFDCVKVYTLKFSVIKFVWKLRKWLRKCENLDRKSVV